MTARFKNERPPMAMLRADSMNMVSKRPSNSNIKASAPSPLPAPVSRMAEWQTYRVDFIPPTATSVSLPRYFGEQDRPRIKVRSLCPSIGKKPSDNPDPRLTSVLSFAPKTGGSRYPRQIDERVRTDPVRLDCDFVGFTPLSYSPDAAVDVVFIPAIGSHPFDSWAEGSLSNGECWPVDHLPRQVPKARVLLYGYTPEDYEEVENNIYNKAETFLRRFQRLRRGEGREDRPVVYVAHSTGCLVLKKILCESVEDVENDLIKSVIFLGAPHDGFDRKTCSLISNGQMQRNLISELSPGSNTILDLNADFSHVADQLHIVAAYESRETQTEQGWPEILVAMDTATLFKSSVIAIDADHRGLAWAQKREAGFFDDVVGSIKDEVNKVTKPAGWRAQSISISGPVSPALSDRFSEEDPFSSSLKSFTLNSASATPPKQGHLERVHTASSELQAKAMNFSSALRGRKKSVPFLQRAPTSDPSSREIFALHEALRNRDFHLAHVLVERYIDFDLKDPQKDNRTVLHEAAIAGDSEITRALLEAGAMAECRTHISLRTPMHYACAYGHEHIVKMLLDRGVKVNARSADESTALHNAAERGHFNIVKLLVERDAGVNMLRGGKTPIDVSRESGNTKTSEYLYEKGSRPNPRKPSKSPEFPGLF